MINIPTQFQEDYEVKCEPEQLSTIFLENAQQSTCLAKYILQIN